MAASEPCSLLLSTEDHMTISAQPTAGLSYDPSEAKYWDENGLRSEIERAFELCNSCRMCFKYCDSFPDLFKLLDEKHEGDARKVTADLADARSGIKFRKCGSRQVSSGRRVHP